MYNIDFHADDYAISPNNSKRIIELISAGRLDSFSIIANMGCFEECMTLLREAWPGFSKKPLISVHINLIDGFFLSGNHADSIQNNSWGRLFIRSLIPLPGRKRLKQSLTDEICAQIKAVNDAVSSLTDDNGQPVRLRLDSHVHTHMIPLVFDSMTDALKRLNLLDKTDYIRNSAEPLKMFFSTPGIRGTFPFVNVIKNIILNILSYRVSHRCRKLGISSGILWGLVMTGHMDKKRVNLLLEQMTGYASSRDLYLEILCHPGIVLKQEVRPEYGEADMMTFFSSDRDIEYDMIMNHS